jgi:hypothetical protein
VVGTNAKQGTRRFGDQAWELAQKNDVTALERAAALHLRDASGIEYEGYRARAFALAVRNRVAEALSSLNEGWTDEWPTPAAYATDVARIHLLAGDCTKALTALQLDLRAVDQLHGLTDFTVACVRREPALWWSALRLAVRGERGHRKVVAAFAVARARLTAPKPQPGISSTIFPS